MTTSVQSEASAEGLQPPNILTLEAVDLGFKAEAGDGVPKFQMVAYSGVRLRQRYYPQGLVINLAALTGLDKARPILMEHNASRAVGHTTAIWIENGQLFAEGELSVPGEDRERIRNSGKAGFPWQASVGIDISDVPVDYVGAGKSIEVNGRRFEGPVYISGGGVLREITITPMGLDDSTRTVVAAFTERNGTMAESEATQEVKLNAGDQSRLNEIQSERGRVAILAEFPELDRDDRLRIEESAIKAGWDNEHLRLEATRQASNKMKLNAMRDALPKAPPVGGPENGGRSTANNAGVIEAALCMTAGMSEERLLKAYGERTLEAASAPAYRGMSIVQAMRHGVRAAGKSPDQLGSPDSSDFVRASISGGFVAASGFSTISLPGILGNVAEKALLEAYEMTETCWRTFSRITTLSNFKPTAMYRLSDKGELEEVGEGGELKHGTLTEESQAVQAKTVGKLLTLSRQAIKNDDLGSFLQLPMLMGMTAAAGLEKAVFTTLLGGSGSFFTVGNGNYLSGAASGLTVDSLSNAETLFRSQAGPNELPIMVKPSHLITGASTASTARQLINSEKIVISGTTDRDTPSGNPHYEMYQPHVAHFIGNDAMPVTNDGAWFLTADGRSGAAPINVGFLDGKQTPTVESNEAPFDVLGMSWRIYFDYGVGLGDRRGAVMSAGE